MGEKPHATIALEGSDAWPFKNRLKNKSCSAVLSSVNLWNSFSGSLSHELEAKAFFFDLYLKMLLGSFFTLPLLPGYVFEFRLIYFDVKHYLFLWCFSVSTYTEPGNGPISVADILFAQTDS